MATTLLTLPSEILARILDFLPISCCNDLRSVLKNSPFYGLYEDRISLEQYFSKNLYDGRKLLKILRETDAYLYASRALEYFIPGSTTVSSDWNFYVPHNARKVQHFMQSMESVGTVWEPVHTTVTRLVHSRKNFVISTIKLQQAFTNIMLECSDALGRKVISDILDSINSTEGSARSYLTATKYDSKEKVTSYYQVNMSSTEDLYQLVKDTDMEQIGSSNFDIVYGYLGRHKVTLAKPKVKYYGTDFLLNMPTTAAQCFITGFGAGAMYGVDLLHKRAVAWSVSKIDIYHKDKDISKYKDRGYSIETSAPLQRVRQFIGFRHRSILDNDSVFVKARYDESWSTEHWEIAQAYICYSEWRENIESVSSITDRKFGASFNYSIVSYPLFRSKLLPSTIDKEYLRLYNLIFEPATIYF